MTTRGSNGISGRSSQGESGGGRVLREHFHRVQGKRAKLGAGQLEGFVEDVMRDGDDVATARLGRYAKEIQTRKVIAPFEFPFPPREVVAFFRQYFGPVQVAFSRLDGLAGVAYEEDLVRLWSDHNQAGTGKTYVASEFLEVVAIRV